MKCFFNGKEFTSDVAYCKLGHSISTQFTESISSQTPDNKRECLLEVSYP